MPKPSPLSGFGTPTATTEQKEKTLTKTTEPVTQEINQKSKEKEINENKAVSNTTKSGGSSADGIFGMIKQTGTTVAKTSIFNNNTEKTTETPKPSIFNATNNTSKPQKPSIFSNTEQKSTIFSNSNSSGGIFQNSTSSKSSTGPTGGIFQNIANKTNNSEKPPSKPSIFGSSKENTPAKPSIFGSKENTPAKTSIFGSKPTNNNISSSKQQNNGFNFGSPKVTTTTASTQQSPFNNPSTPTISATNSIFGNQNTASTFSPVSSQASPATSERKRLKPRSRRR